MHLDVIAEFEVVDERLGELRQSRRRRPGQGWLPFCLKLDQRKKRGLSDWLTQANLFYANLLANPDDLAAMGRFRMTRERLAEGQASESASPCLCGLLLGPFVISFDFGDAGFILAIPDRAPLLLRDDVLCVFLPRLDGLQISPIGHRDAHAFASRFCTEESRLLGSQLDHALRHFAVAVIALWYLLNILGERDHLGR